MKLQLCVFLSTFLLIAATVQAQAEDKKDTVQAEVFQFWIHSHEEDTGTVNAYRPKGFKFPPSRGRKGFEIRENGEFVDHPIAPADGNLTVPGTWELAGAEKITVTFPKKPDHKPFTLEIVSCDNAVLRIKQTETGR